MKENKKVHIETWGCQMNVADSEAMFQALKEQGYDWAVDPEEADLVILNTCHIREKSRHKVVSRLGVLRDIKKRTGMRIALTGCVAQAEGAQLAREIPEIDMVLGPGRLGELTTLLSEKTSVVARGFPKDVSVLPTGSSALKGQGISRYLTIQRGCNNFCTFCVVPLTRGEELSQSPQEIYEEAQKLLDGGAREITLLGQNVNSYGLDLLEKGMISSSQGPFVDLLEKLGTLKNLMSLRFTTSNPHDFTKPLADLFQKMPVLGKYYHLPVQSGSNRILATMKRKVTVEDYEERVSWLRKAVPDMALSTDLIVGFPGETEEDFEETLALMEKVRFSFVYAFQYSPRKGTAAARFVDKVPEKIKAQRLARLHLCQGRIAEELLKEEISKIRDVLFLYPCKKNPDYLYGRTPHFRLIKVRASSDLLGHKAPVQVMEGNLTALMGSLV